MLRRISDCCALGVLLFLHAATASACFAPRDAKPTSTETQVALKTVLDRPHYYFVLEGVVVFIPPDFVYASDGSSLAQAMPHVALQEHTDLLKFVLFDGHTLQDARYIVADALEAGAALLYNSQYRRYADRVKVVTFNDVCSGGRRISYDNNGREDDVVRTLDWIS